MKKKSGLYLLLAFVLIASVFSAFVITANAESAEPTELEMNIAYCNLSFCDSVCIKYAVSSNVSDVKILIWTAPEEEYIVGTHDDELTEYYNDEICGVSHMIFDYTDLKAKQMTDVVYARAYSKVDGKDYYSELNKYSILQYAYNKLGKTATASTNEELKTMLTNMLVYGASAQQYFDYKEDRLATADWYQVKITAGVLDDGSMNGLYLPGDKVTLIAPEENDNGEPFVCWTDKNGNNISTTPTHELTVGTSNETYTPTYKPNEHTVVIDEAIPATCTKLGLSEGAHCSVCGEVLLEQEVLTALPHQYGEDSKCTVCGEGRTSEGLEYTFKAEWNSYLVTGIGTCTDTEIVIPAVYNGFPVVRITTDVFRGNTDIKSIDLGFNMDFVENYAFEGCTSLTKVVFAENDFTIGDYAFKDCTALKNIAIPHTLHAYGTMPFSGCTSLVKTVYKNVEYLGDNVNPYVVAEKAINTDILSINLHPDTVFIASSAFKDCINITELITPSKLERINASAFQNCTALNRVVLNDGLTVIGNSAFRGCTALNELELSDTITTINGLAFEKCTSLSSVRLPNALTILNYNAFQNCYNLSEVTFGSEITTIGKECFKNCRSLKSIVIPATVTSVGADIFAYVYNVVIYCESDSKPEGWAETWNSTEREVIWGFQQ